MKKRELEQLTRGFMDGLSTDLPVNGLEYQGERYVDGYGIGQATRDSILTEARQALEQAAPDSPGQDSAPATVATEDERPYPPVPASQGNAEQGTREGRDSGAETSHCPQCRASGYTISPFLAFCESCEGTGKAPPPAVTDESPGEGGGGLVMVAPEDLDALQRRVSEAERKAMEAEGDSRFALQARDEAIRRAKRYREAIERHRDGLPQEANELDCELWATLNPVPE